tara:strand:+ start:702 stop:1040 length:339 start_codon:yes stop_codon:yes gene_type:complete
MKTDYTTQYWVNQLPRKAKANINDILNLCFKHSYDLIHVNNSNGMLRFKKLTNDGKISVNIYSTTFTVTTEINHPKKGKTQLHRRLNGLQNRLVILENILINPRIHTGKGYY